MKEISLKGKYFEAVGRRKTSTARVRLYPDEGNKNVITVNGKDFKIYFPTAELRHRINQVLDNSEIKSKFTASVLLSGGGIHSQADALRLGIARALIAHDAELRKPLKKEGFLKRDPRAKERRKFGLKKARKAPQWSKR
ncbi:MAG: 30S ribosomal protein S9 [Candidatus Vogelbacteria bacterium]|nr:30S ribosomal protein S9 [Candidatus Vogelbacteria bacterium]